MGPHLLNTETSQADQVGRCNRYYTHPLEARRIHRITIFTLHTCKVLGLEKCICIRMRMQILCYLCTADLYCCICKNKCIPSKFVLYFLSRTFVIFFFIAQRNSKKRSFLGICKATTGTLLPFFLFFCTVLPPSPSPSPFSPFSLLPPQFHSSGSQVALTPLFLS